MKHDRKQDHNVQYQVFAFGPIRKKNKMTAPAVIGWYIFHLSEENVDLMVCAAMVYRGENKD